MLSPFAPGFVTMFSSFVIVMSAMAGASAFVQPHSSHIVVERRPSSVIQPFVRHVPPNDFCYSVTGRTLCMYNNNNDNNNNSSTNIDPGTKLLLCILIDLIGISSFAAPGIGETTDVAWAPISAVLINYLFGNGIFTALAFVEELLPGFDIIPTATIAWFLENGNRNEAPAPPGPNNTGNNNPQRPKQQEQRSLPDAIDVDVIDKK